MVFRRHLVLLFTLALTLPTTIFATVRSVPLLISTKRLENLSPERTKLVHVGQKEYEALFQKYKKAHEAVLEFQEESQEGDKKEDKGKVTILFAKLKGEQVGNRLKLHYSLSIRLSKEGPYFVPLALRHLAIANVVHRGPKGAKGTVLLGEQGKGKKMYALLSGAGDHELDFQGSAPITEKGGIFSCYITLPGASIQTMAIKLAGSEVNVRRQTIRNLPFEVRSLPTGQTEVAGACGNMKSFLLSWTLFKMKRRAPKKRKVEAPRLFANLSSLFLVKDELTLSFSQLQVVNSGGPTATLDLQLPQGATPKGIEGPLVRKIVHLGEKEGRLLRLYLKEPLKGTTTITALTESMVPANIGLKSRQVALAPPTLVDARRQQVVVGVTALCPAQLVTKEQGEKVRLVDPASLPRAITSQSATPVVLAYGYTLDKGRKKPKLSVEVTPFVTEKILETTINSSNAVTVITEVQRAKEKKKTLTSMTRLILQMVNGSRKHLTVHLPENAEVTGCFVNFESANPALVKGSKGKTILIPLIKSVYERNGLLPYPVSLTYRLDLPKPLSNGGSLAYKLPAFDVPVSDTSWKVYTPEGYTFLHFKGNVEDAKEFKEFILIRAADWLFNDVVMMAIGLLLTLALLALILLLFFKGASGLASIVADLRSSGCGSIFICALIVLSIIGMLAAISVPNFRKARERANSRACYANQKTVAGALEMYNLDNNASVPRLTDEVWRNLREQGYLQTVPDDPGFGSGSHHNYRLTAEGDIYCTCHGGIQKNPASSGYHRAFKKRAAQYKKMQRSSHARKSITQNNTARHSHIAPVNFRIPKTGQYTLLLRSFLVANDEVHFSSDYLSARSFQLALLVIVIFAGLIVLALSSYRGVPAIVLLLLVLVIPALLDELHTTFALWFFFGSLVYLVALRGKALVLHSYSFFKNLLNRRTAEVATEEGSAQ